MPRGIRRFDRKNSCVTLGIPLVVTTTTSRFEFPSPSARRPLELAATTAEVLLVYSSILVYIWRWQFSYPRVSIVLLAMILATHFWHGDSPRELGLTLNGLRAGARAIAPLFLPLAVALVVVAVALFRGTLAIPWQYTLKMFGIYCVWCAFQQYLAQSYFHHRLMSVIPNHHVSSAIVALLFGAAHIPNLVLMVATTLGGFIFAETFARHRNIWPIAVTQAVAGYLIVAIFPIAVTHNMRVGPGYYWFGH